MYKIALFCLALFLGACSSETNHTEENSSDLLYIVTTTGMVKDVVSNIVGETAKVISLMGPGVDPHYYKASQGDLTELRKADIIFYNGLKLEGKMQDVFEKLAEEKPVFAITDKLDRASLRVAGNYNDEAVTYDPHIWFDVVLWSHTIPYIMECMIKQRPEHADLYQANAKAYLETLNQLNQSVEKQIESVAEEQRILVTSHDAFGYFGDAYNIEVHALQGISTVSEFGIKDITNMVNLITDRKIKAIFVESSVSPKSIEAVIKGCEEKGHIVRIGGTLFSDAMGDEGIPEGTYVGMVKHNVKTFVSAIK